MTRIKFFAAVAALISARPIFAQSRIAAASVVGSYLPRLDVIRIFDPAKGAPPTGTNTPLATFTLLAAPVPGMPVQLFWNGLAMAKPDDYTIAGSVVMLHRITDHHDIIQVAYYSS